MNEKIIDRDSGGDLEKDPQEIRAKILGMADTSSQHQAYLRAVYAERVLGKKTQSEIAAKLGVSIRTLQRDLEYFKALTQIATKIATEPEKLTEIPLNKSEVISLKKELPTLTATQVERKLNKSGADSQPRKQTKSQKKEAKPKLSKADFPEGSIVRFNKNAIEAGFSQYKFQFGIVLSTGHHAVSLQLFKDRVEAVPFYCLDPRSSATLSATINAAELKKLIERFDTPADALRAALAKTEPIAKTFKQHENVRIKDGYALNEIGWISQIIGRDLAVVKIGDSNVYETYSFNQLESLE